MISAMNLRDITARYYRDLEQQHPESLDFSM